jgi:hypothetical protein
MRTLEELVITDDPAWPALRSLFADSPVPVAVLPRDLREAHRALLQLQVTARSTLGALTLNTGGLVLDDGWVRVYGGGAGTAEDTLPSLAQVNEFPAEPDPAWHPGTGLVVAHDVVGGVFALNGADPAAVGRPGVPGQLTYFAPDTLEWESLEMGHSTWIAWLLSGRLEEFYQSLRWPGWREEAAALTFDQGITVYPFLWTGEAHQDLGATARSAVPTPQVLGVEADFARQIGAADPGFLGKP